MHSEVARYYGHFLTPGHVLSALYEELSESRVSIEEIIRYFVVTQFNDNIFTKLDQAGSSSDVRPGVHHLFIDLPFSIVGGVQRGEILSELCCAAAQCHRYSLRSQYPEKWRAWNRDPKRARVTLIKGGPGQGKSTVSQYLCQIHRASLILDNDGPTVVETIKTAAEEIHAAAERDGFWPTSSRIPIQIELKEFAHWYSQRNADQSTNVLTYLANAIEKKLGSTVSAKTIKNTLSKRSWIVVFDGLDEVPNDNKDEVANEVMYFLNEVLLEIDGDVLAVCTSRPQGYSGQFAGIDGPVIQLNLLDENIAISCAKPVLKFGRTSEESEKSIEILETAILSPSIKELMTTPLQSHIMAVVVRDGGRPPERRWQLFNGFYLVMKKRESLKDFKNPRIAKLLREEDKLLKSVHTRLGFVLHARAERSEGAQTALSKEEFRELVKDVVIELFDHDIEQTIADVMEAVTERLVLVSTPENGEQVRFDIRQLQEFFAAEFLYTGVDSNELSERITTIGGDSHWREVIHFLLSALIENQRTTELAVSMQVLSQLNEGDETSSDKLYCRRMAKASLLASRLLIEGVLEQDKGDRQKIKPLLEPLCGIFDMNVLLNLGRINPSRSRLWFIDFLLDKIEVASPREYVGALLLLGWLLPDESDKSAKVAAAFLNISIGWQEHLYSLWLQSLSGLAHKKPVPTHRKQLYKNISQWVIDVTVSILNSSNWSNYNSELIGHLFAICREDNHTFSISCKKIGIDEKVANSIFKCLILKNEVIESENRAVKEVDCGLIRAIPYSENWYNGKIPNELINISAKNNLSEIGGAFKLMLSCLWFAQEPSGLAIKDLITQIDQVTYTKLALLPRKLLALIPINGAYSEKQFSIDHLREIDTNTDGWLARLISEQKIQPLYNLSVKVNRISTPEQWQLSATYLPSITIDLAFNWKAFLWELEPHFVPELISVISNMPHKTYQNILNWGSLVESQPDLLKSLKDNACALKTQEKFSFHVHTVVSPFKLKLPDEIQVITLLAPALIEWYEDDTPRLSLRNVSNMAEEQSLHVLLNDYGLSSSELRDIAVIHKYDQAVRASALALFWLLQRETDTKLDLIQEQKHYKDLVNEINEVWLTQAFISGVLIRYTETNSDAIEFLTYLMERCNEGRGPIDPLIKLLSNWRERSTAPVHSKEVFFKWLGNDQQPPTYASIKQLQ